MVVWSALGAIILPNIGGWASAKIVSHVGEKDGKPSWYDTLKKPDWSPPNYAFPPVWTALYSGMGYASYLVYKDGGGFCGPAKLPLILYGSQLALNWAWMPIFFGAHKLKWSLIEITAFSANVAVCGIAFYNINKTAGYLFMPYVAWCGLATALTYAIWRDNPEEEGPKITELKDK